MENREQNGFSMVEVLVTLVVLAVGLLGLAGLQISGLSNNLIAEQRTVASQLAYDMADRIRTNVADASLGAASVYITQAPIGAAANASCLQVAGSCDAAELAEHDLFEWNRDIVNALPMGVGEITVDASGAFTIGVNWDENKDASVSGADIGFETNLQL